MMGGPPARFGLYAKALPYRRKLCPPPGVGMAAVSGSISGYVGWLKGVITVFRRVSAAIRVSMASITVFSKLFFTCRDGWASSATSPPANFNDFLHGDRAVSWSNSSIYSALAGFGLSASSPASSLVMSLVPRHCFSSPSFRPAADDGTRPTRLWSGR